VLAKQALVVYLSINVLALVVPSEVCLVLPDKLRFIDPNGDGILNALELQLVTTKYSTLLLAAVLSTCLSAFCLKAKRPPVDWSREGRNVISHYWEKVHKRDGTFILLDLALTMLIVWLACLQWFKFFGWTTQAVLTFGVVGGIAFGLAAKNVVGNMISGLLIFITQPFLIGDYIETRESSGIVKRVSWSFTELETKEGPIVRIPNSKVVNACSNNRTTGKVRAIEIQFPIRFPEGGFEQCDELFEGLTAVISELPICKSRLTQQPDVLFNGIDSLPPGNIPRLQVTMLVNNEGLGETDEIESEVYIASMNHLMSQGLQIPGLEC